MKATVSNIDKAIAFLVPVLDFGTACATIEVAAQSRRYHFVNDPAGSEELNGR
ncbi:hypothetical protein [Microseira wollei]|uniref:Transposase n=1 Tax=Microseira wollei NIES-4236 TaxID=2530354 RepID=A0AAV3XSY1_9CYAN|nr:hypothetical protein [Microseira wollei]GET44264.1 hypothetical protein MiSe_90900 [Microseira wollei NIES-4236]